MTRCGVLFVLSSCISLTMGTLAFSSPDLEFQERQTEIQAESYEIRIIKKSESKKTYLFESTPRDPPRVGRIILLKQGSDPVMAFRILKTHPDKRLFIGTSVRRYGNFHELQVGDSYTLLEKVGEITPQLPESEAEATSEVSELENPEQDELGDDSDIEDDYSEASVQIMNPPTAPVPEGAAPSASHARDIDSELLDEEDLSDGGDLPEEEAEESPPVISSSAKSYDPELDVGSSPPPKGATEPPEIEDGPDSSEDLAVEEVTPLDTNRHWFTGGFSLIRNSSPGGNSMYFSAAGLRYGLSIIRVFAFRSTAVQDSLVLEGGTSLYKVADFAAAGDAYTVFNGSFTVRYNIIFRDFGFFFYGGLARNQVIASSPVTTNASSTLTGLWPAAGGGMFFHIGPNWDIRTDVGMDTLGIGLMLRF